MQFLGQSWPGSVSRLECTVRTQLTDNKLHRARCLAEPRRQEAAVAWINGNLLMVCPPLAFLQSRYRTMTGLPRGAGALSHGEGGASSLERVTIETRIFNSNALRRREWPHSL